MDFKAVASASVRGLAIAAATIVVASAAQAPPAQSAARRTLEIYVIDVEGGEATLFVSPSGESMLVDTGWPGFEGRDADRIAAVAKQAGISQVDYLVVTHFHADHMGGASQLSARLPIRHFVDHGASVERGERAEAAFNAYGETRSRGVHVVAKPGDTIPIKGLEVKVIAAGGAVLDKPLAGGGAPNPLCQTFKFQEGEVIRQEQTTRAEDPQSVSLFVSFEKFRTIIMGDLTWNKEHDLMCPVNKVGTVDAYLVSHHGADTSGSEALVHPLRARAALMNNGPRKGGAVQTFKILRASPGLEDLWQNHYSIPGGQEHNRPEPFIANLEKDEAVHMGPAHWLKLSAQPDGTFTVTNSRNRHTKTYPASASGSERPKR